MHNFLTKEDIKKIEGEIEYHKVVERKKFRKMYFAKYCNFLIVRYNKSKG